MRHCKMTAGTRRIGRSKAAERLPEERPPEDAPRIAAAPVLEAEEFGHPVFGLAPVIAVGVARLTYQSGDVRTRPFAEPLGTLRPEELADPSVIGSHFGPGRYRLNPIGAGGRLVAQPQVIDCRGEDGTVPLVAEMPGAPVVAAAVRRRLRPARVAARATKASRRGSFRTRAAWARKGFRCLRQTNFACTLRPAGRCQSRKFERLSSCTA